MMFWIILVLFFGLDLGFGLLGDAGQAVSDFAILQAQAAALAWLLFIREPYGDTYRKAATLVLLIYTLWVVATDWAIAWFPTWGPAIEATLFSAIILRTLWKIHAVQGHKAR